MPHETPRLFLHNRSQPSVSRQGKGNIASLPCKAPRSACSKPRSMAHTTANSQAYSFPSRICFPQPEGQWRQKQPRDQLRSCARGPRREGWSKPGPGFEFSLGSVLGSRSKGSSMPPRVPTQGKVTNTGPGALGTSQRVVLGRGKRWYWGLANVGRELGRALHHTRAPMPKPHKPRGCTTAARRDSHPHTEAAWPRHKKWAAGQAEEGLQLPLGCICTGGRPTKLCSCCSGGRLSFFHIHHEHHSYMATRVHMHAGWGLF